MAPNLVHRWIAPLDYGVVLPALAKPPLWCGVNLSAARGVIHFLFDLDWRSISLQKRYVRQATYRTMQTLLPGRSRLTWIIKTLQRFIVNSREEYEATLFLRKDMAFLKNRCKVHGLEALLDAQKNGRSIVLLTPHFDSFISGTVLMGMHGLRIHCMKTATVEDPRVPQAISEFYQNKYGGMEQYLNGGRILDYERHLKFFYRALRQGDSVLVAADIPHTTSRRYLQVPFLGKHRKMAAGPLSLAEKTGAFVCAFSCVYQGVGTYSLTCSPLYPTTDGNALKAFEQAYGFLHNVITANPGCWWAADIMQSYTTE